MINAYGNYDYIEFISGFYPPILITFKIRLTFLATPVDNTFWIKSTEFYTFIYTTSQSTQDVHKMHNNNQYSSSLGYLKL